LYSRTVVGTLSMLLKALKTIEQPFAACYEASLQHALSGAPIRICTADCRPAAPGGSPPPELEQISSIPLDTGLLMDAQLDGQYP
jgi:hypothetical protein